MWSLEQDWRISKVYLPVCELIWRWPTIAFCRFSWDRQRLFVGSTPVKKICHRWSRDQLQPGSFFQRQGKQRRESMGTRLVINNQWHVMSWYLMWMFNDRWWQWSMTRDGVGRGRVPHLRSGKQLLAERPYVGSKKSTRVNVVMIKKKVH